MRKLFLAARNELVVAPDGTRVRQNEALAEDEPTQRVDPLEGKSHLAWGSIQQRVAGILMVVVVSWTSVQ